MNCHHTNWCGFGLLKLAVFQQPHEVAGIERSRLIKLPSLRHDLLESQSIASRADVADGFGQRSAAFFRNLRPSIGCATVPRRIRTALNSSSRVARSLAPVANLPHDTGIPGNQDATSTAAATACQHSGTVSRRSSSFFTGGNMELRQLMNNSGDGAVGPRQDAHRRTRGLQVQLTNLFGHPAMPRPATFVGRVTLHHGRRAKTDVTRHRFVGSGVLRKSIGPCDTRARGSLPGWNDARCAGRSC